MIALTHFGNGKRIALNVDLIEKVEETPDTVITLTNGARYLVQESLDQIIDKSIEVRARALFVAQHLPDPDYGQRLRLLPGGDGTPGSDGSGCEEAERQAVPDGNRPNGDS